MSTATIGASRIPRSLLVFGAGAVGCYYGARLARRGMDLHFVARGDHLEAMCNRGLQVESIDGDLHLDGFAATPTVPERPFDLILLAVKTYQTAAALEAIAPAVGAETRIWSLQNGIDNEDLIAARYGAERTWGGVCFIGSERVAPGRIRHTAAGHASLGAWQGDGEEARRFAESVFDEKTLRLTFAADIRSVLWHKLMWNAAFNTTTCLAGVPARAMLETKAGLDLVRAAMAEVRAVAEAEGARLPADAEQAYIDRTLAMGEVRTSMWVDREHGRPLEHESIAGALVRRAERAGIEVPIARSLYAMLETWDRFGRNSG